MRKRELEREKVIRKTSIEREEQRKVETEYLEIDRICKKERERDRI